MLIDVPLDSPHSGNPLSADCPHSLTDGTWRYPVVDGIPYLRVAREALCAQALQHLDAGDFNKARTALLQDQDDWAKTEKPTVEAIQQLTQANLSLRDAMRALNFGPVADYFAYRWSDPTYLSGLVLLENHLPAEAKVLEVACGIGHYLREFEVRKIPALGMDVVFAKLWLARRYVAPETTLVCADVEARLPFADSSVNAAFCHDAFYFFRGKPHVIAELKRVSGDQGVILIGHTHCAEADNFSSGEALRITDYRSLLPEAILYEDSELTQSVVEERHPVSGVRSGCAAIAMAHNRANPSHQFTMPLATMPLRLNPLFQDGQPHWPSPRYREEYAGLSQYLCSPVIPSKPDEVSIRKRIYVSLPEQW